MEPTELEKNLSALEEKIERVRALYEQYFVGVEKLEPQIPRKDVDRLLLQMRKEQIRNTALRFKFQMLVQRFNTLQQHWGRTMREIENGTYRRDMLRAAARFGVEDALTAVGKKQAEKIKRLLDSQTARQGSRKEKRPEEVFEEVSTGDVELLDDFDDDAPTPPPAVGQPQRAQRPRGPAVYTLDDIGDGEDPTGVTGPLFPSSPNVDERRPRAISLSPGGSAEHEIPAAPQSSSGEPVKKKGGLRWGGGGLGPRKADPEALKRMASLAGAEAAGAAARVDAPPMRKPLMSQPLDLGLPEPEVEAPKPAPRRPLLDNPLDIDLGPSSIERPPATAAAPAAASASSGGAPAEQSQSPKRPQLRPPPQAAQSKNADPSKSPGREFGELNEGRLREIYGQYVQARRTRNESTAGITFEKLADSLRSQADKLKGKHGSKRVDYEVVVKDGKTLIKPIVK